MVIVMTRNGMSENCVCHQLKGEPRNDASLTLLSEIPNQRIYRCGSCQAFLSFTEDRQSWEVLMQGDVEEEIKSLYSPASLLSPSA